VMGERPSRLALSITAKCGMYDHSGEWMARVGLPAKSGVGAGIVAVQPAQFGVGVYSPRPVIGGLRPACVRPSR